ncbi:MAG: hypothetical protein LBM93_12365 [Oscillospiraceae bacterium]|jgi:hypothetical protein|nr:hypothetical protein [Oscillospiraceae bacterium]
MTCKKHLKKPIKIFLIIIVCILVFNIIYFLSKPIRLPNKLVEKYLFLEIPKDTTMEDAIFEIEKNEWEIRKINYDYGVHFGKNSKPNTINLENEENLVGSKFIYVYLGEYTVVFECFVYAYLIFDENSKLIQIVVIKDLEAM